MKGRKEGDHIANYVVGPRGTGKSQVAKVIAQIMKEEKKIEPVFRLDVDDFSKGYEKYTDLIEQCRKINCALQEGVIERCVFDFWETKELEVLKQEYLLGVLNYGKKKRANLVILEEPYPYWSKSKVMGSTQATSGEFQNSISH